MYVKLVAWDVGGQINVRRATGIPIHTQRTFYVAQKGYKMSKYFDGWQK